MRRVFFVLAMMAFVGALVFGAAVGLGYEPPNPDAYGPPRQVTELRSQVASLEAALYVAERQACPSLGVHPVPPPAGRSR